MSCDVMKFIEDPTVYNWVTMAFLSNRFEGDKTCEDDKTMYIYGVDQNSKTKAKIFDDSIRETPRLSPTQAPNSLIVL